jgi:sialate O-acetylesterase
MSLSFSCRRSLFQKVKTSRLLASLLCVVAPSLALADVQLPPVFSDHMVLQAGRPVPVWGKASPGEKVSVRTGAQVKKMVGHARSAEVR